MQLLSVKDGKIDGSNDRFLPKKATKIKSICKKNKINRIGINGKMYRTIFVCLQFFCYENILNEIFCCFKYVQTQVNM